MKNAHFRYNHRINSNECLGLSSSSSQTHFTCIGNAPSLVFAALEGEHLQFTQFTSNFIYSLIAWPAIFCFAFCLHAYLDLDECISVLLHNCSDTFTCVNVQGSYRCECPPGMAYILEANKCEGRNKFGRLNYQQVTCSYET